MSLSKVKQALTAFLTDDTPQVVALSGKWGRGKSYYWNKFLATSPSGLPTGVTQASYISLFGIPSIEALRDSVFENAIPISDLRAPPTEGDADASSMAPGGGGVRARLASLVSRANRGGRKYAKLVEALPPLKDLAPLLRSAIFLTVKGYVVCFDDLERHSDSLSLRDILGFVTLLREQRRCRVLVILNTDALNGQDQKEYQLLREKVFDYEIAFDPTPSDCASLVFTDAVPHYKAATDQAIKLGITNIRILWRIRRVIDLFYPHVASLDPSVLKQVVDSAVLLTWAYNSRGEGAPAFEYLRTLNHGSFITMEGIKEPTAEELAWNEKLQEYGYVNTDDLDRAIANCLEDGFIDDAAVAKVVANRHGAAVRSGLEAAFSGAWHIFHSGFGDDAGRLSQALIETFKPAAQWISIHNVSATTMLLRDLGKGDAADALIDHWIAVHAEDPSALDPSEWRMFGEIKDRRLLELASQAALQLDRPPTLSEVVHALAGKNGWSEQEEQVMVGASEDQYYELLKSLSGDDVRACVNACLKFGTFANASAEYRGMADRVQGALRRLGAESPLNRRRVESFGIEMLEIGEHGAEPPGESAETA